MKKCQGFCCYDGVYLKENEEQKLRDIIKSHPQDFNPHENCYFTDGNWNNKVKGRKTAVRPFNYSENFPPHFTRTKCLFADDEGLCILQKIAIREKIHPWHYKPRACCLFPLVLRNGNLVPPPNKDEKDDYYIDENYKGFINCLYCGQDCNDGVDWKIVLQEELRYGESLK